MKKNAVEFRSVYKEYPIYHHVTAGLKSFLFNLPKKIASMRKEKFVALSDVSFSIKKGETFGIVGRNGAGKSTLLGLIAQVIRPDKGKISVQGRVSSLLELGAGFHPELTGEENIVLNGILLGMKKKEIEKKMDDIVEFAGLGEFIDQPVRTYSSGMYVRLGFSVAVNIEPDILLVDEAMAVGDIDFQKKCIRKMKEFKAGGVTIVFVSHDLNLVQGISDRAALLSGGTIVAEGDPEHISEVYIGRLSGGGEGAPALAAGAQNGVSMNWWESPLVAEHMRGLATGDPNLTLVGFLGEKYVPSALGRALALTGSDRDVGRGLVESGLCLEAKNVKVAGSLPDFGGGPFDLVFSDGALNALSDIEGFLAGAEGALKDGGLFIAKEYVGPGRYQWKEEELDVANKLFGLLPLSMRMDARTKELKEAIVRPSPPPDEALRSEDVIGSIKGRFETLTVRHFGGALYPLVFEGTMGNFNPLNVKDAAIVRMILYIERLLTEKGVLSNNYALIVARKRAGA